MNIYVMLLDAGMVPFGEILSCERFEELLEPEVITNVLDCPARTMYSLAEVLADPALIFDMIYFVDPDPLYLNKVNDENTLDTVAYNWKLVPIESLFSTEAVKNIRMHCINALLNPLNT